MVRTAEANLNTMKAQAHRALMLELQERADIAKGLLIKLYERWAAAENAFHTARGEVDGDFFNLSIRNKSTDQQTMKSGVELMSEAFEEVDKKKNGTTEWVVAYEKAVDETKKLVEMMEKPRWWHGQW